MQIFGTGDRIVLGHAECRHAAQALATLLDCDYGEIQIHHFPDGESRVKVPTEVASNVILYRSLDRPNHKLIEFLLSIRTLRDNGAQHITLIAPYLCYMRQDCAFETGDAISQQVIGEFLAQHVDALITVDPHLHRVHELKEAIPCPVAINITAAPLFRDYLDQHQRDAILLGPDAESEQWVASIAGNEYTFGVASKQRLGDRDVEIRLPDLPLHNRTTVLIDDVISTGQTLLKTVEALQQLQPAKIIIMVTHALFADEDFDQILFDRGVADIISTDSIPHHSNQLSLASLIAEVINE